MRKCFKQEGYIVMWKMLSRKEGEVAVDDLRGKQVGVIIVKLSISAFNLYLSLIRAPR